MSSVLESISQSLSCIFLIGHQEAQRYFFWHFILCSVKMSRTGERRYASPESSKLLYCLYFGILIISLNLSFSRVCRNISSVKGSPLLEKEFIYIFYFSVIHRKENTKEKFISSGIRKCCGDDFGIGCK